MYNHCISSLKRFGVVSVRRESNKCQEISCESRNGLSGWPEGEEIILNRVHNLSSMRSLSNSMSLYSRGSFHWWLYEQRTIRLGLNCLTKYDFENILWNLIALITSCSITLDMKWIEFVDITAYDYEGISYGIGVKLSFPPHRSIGRHIFRIFLIKTSAR